MLVRLQTSSESAGRFWGHARGVLTNQRGLIVCVALSSLLASAIALVVLRSSLAPTGRAEGTRLLDLLEPEGGPVTSPTKPAMPSAQAAVPAVPPVGSTLQLPVRVGLLSQRPIRRVEPLDGGSCQIVGASSTTSLSQHQQISGVMRSINRGALVCSGGRIRINGRTYRSTMHLIQRGDGWLAVNELDLEDYIASVVGAEMPSQWHGEALKAQAVAARSYAMAHLARPAAADYNLGDTTRWQVFAGDGSVSGPSLEAARATRGIILTYEGGIVESLYAANRSISIEAHGHLGASMSQSGAQDLALQGLPFNAILGRYYRGASLARLRNDGG